MRRKTQSSANRFFSDNALKTPSVIISYSSEQIKPSLQTQSSKQLKESKRVQKTQSARLNPKNFIHREVFNTSLYKNMNSSLSKDKLSMNKFFHIQISKEERKLSQLGDQEGSYLKTIAQILSHSYWYQHEQQMKKVWRNIQHNIGILQKYIRFIEDKHPIKYAIKHSIQSIEQFLTLGVKKITRLGNDNKDLQRNISILQMRENTTKQNKKSQPSFEQSSVKLRQQLAENSTINKLKAKINWFQFENNKMILQVEKLQQKVKSLNTELSRNIEENVILKEERKNIIQWKQNYEYKIQKLKEQLEVAHIVKDQNLQDKLNYILGWKL